MFDGIDEFSRMFSSKVRYVFRFNVILSASQHMVYILDLSLPIISNSIDSINDYVQCVE